MRLKNITSNQKSLTSESFWIDTQSFSRHCIAQAVKNSLCRDAGNVKLFTHSFDYAKRVPFASFCRIFVLALIKIQPPLGETLFLCCRLDILKPFLIFSFVFVPIAYRTHIPIWKCSSRIYDTQSTKLIFIICHSRAISTHKKCSLLFL